MSRLQLAGKSAIVTGGATGIGKAICVALAEEGVGVTIADINADTGNQVLQELKDISPTCPYSFVETDVTHPQSVQAMVAAARDTHGKIDILVNNAGINIPRLLVDPAGEEELTPELFDRMYAVNQKGVFLCAQAVAREMIARGEGGTIINMASETGVEGSEGQSAYSGTKGAIYALTRSWAKELGKFNIRVVGLAPAIAETTALRTPQYEQALAYTRGITVAELNRKYEQVSVPLGRAARLDEIADLVLFLASDMASYITGTIVNISGGKSRG